jgi:hypothetical protein
MSLSVQIFILDRILYCSGNMQCVLWGEFNFGLYWFIVGRVAQSV